MPTKASNRAQARFTRAPLAAAILLMTQALPALSQEIEEVLVTAQKRSENMQDVPISIQTLNTKTIEQLNINDFADFAKMLPAVSTSPSLAGVGFTNVYFRGVTTGGDGQATLSQPSVGQYLDEMPITTVQGNLDIHMYDIARVEALAGPQGTLYGASSQAGTIRVITNKPDPGEFSASYTLEGNQVDGDDMGYSGEGYVNIPLSDKAAVRIVGWKRKDAGYIDNVLRSRTYPGDQSTEDDDITVDNSKFAKDNYNTVDTEGGRASLRVDLNDDWTVTGTLMAQKQSADGAFGEDLSGFGGSEGDNQVSHVQEEFVDDNFYQAGLTIEGQVGMFDLVYAGSYLNRNLNSSFDYSDYSYFYDVAYTSGYFAALHISDPNFPGSTADRVWPGARYGNNDNYDRKTHEIRISTPQDNRVRGMIGAFFMDSLHNFEQKWKVDGLSSTMEMNYLEGTNANFNDIVYLNNMDREDTDEAIFGQLAFDITDDLEFKVGARFFKPETTIDGFFGFGLGFNRGRAPGFNGDGSPRPSESTEPGSTLNGGDGEFVDWGQSWSGNGEWRCPSQADYDDTPCKNVDKGIKESDNIFMANLSYTISDDAMVYATWSEGYRPGGINRNPFAGEYVSDFLTNWELGWKTQWFDNSVQFNGAVFFEEWEDFQVGFQGANGITQNVNGPTAEILGTEMDLLWAATENLMIVSSWAYYDSELQDDYCPSCQGTLDINGDGDVGDAGESANWADAGEQLPLTAKFKGNLTARYTMPVGDFEGHMQATLAYQGKRNSSLNIRDQELYYPEFDKNTFLDLTAGLTKESYAVELFIKNVTNEDTPLAITSQCAPATCGQQIYGIPARPRTIGLKFTQNF
jgi:outer membrane receptor protein involved in Fe transport